MTTGQHPIPARLAAVDHIQNVVRDVLVNLHLRPDSSVFIAVSGGPDSLCLADATIEQAAQLGVKPVIAHLNHCLRGTDSDDDSAFVEAFATAHGVQVYIESANVRLLAQTERVSVEVAARFARYGFLQRTAVAAGAHFILLGHNADDQAETLLQRIIRGTGINGLRGMQLVSPLSIGTLYPDFPLTLVRPLLAIPRAEINVYCQSQGLEPRIDHTNADPHYTRNRIRLELLPLLETMNPGIRKVLLHLSETASTDLEIIEYATTQSYRSLVLDEKADSVTFSRKSWQDLPIGLQRTVLRQAIQKVKQNTVDLKFTGIEEARDVLNSSTVTGQIAILSNVRIVVSPSAFTVVKVNY
jgi:tRNA(Ile)-lysidine synthetase-like protein